MDKRVAVSFIYDSNSGELVGVREGPTFKKEVPLMKADIYKDIVNGLMQEELENRYQAAVIEVFGES